MKYFILIFTILLSGYSQAERVSVVYHGKKFVLVNPDKVSVTIEEKKWSESSTRPPYYVIFISEKDTSPPLIYWTPKLSTSEYVDLKMAQEYQKVFEQFFKKNQGTLLALPTPLNDYIYRINNSTNLGYQLWSVSTSAKSLAEKAEFEYHQFMDGYQYFTGQER